MARLVTSGFELGVVEYECDVATAGVTINNTVVRNGTYSMRIASGNDMQFYLGAGYDELYVGFAVYWSSLPNADDIIYFNGSSNTLFNIITNSSGQLNLRRGSTVVASSSQAFVGGQWYYVEIYFKADNATGECTVRVNGTQWATFTGDTINSTNTTVVRVGLYADTNYAYYDDVVINDASGSYNNTWPGQPNLVLAVPNGAGSNTDMTPSAGSNYQCVDEIPVNTTDYVYSNTATDVDTYDITDPLAGTETILNVIVNHVVKVDKGEGSIDQVIIANVTTDNSAAKPLTEGYNRVQECWPINPDDSAAWEPADIDDLEIGQEIA